MSPINSLHQQKSKIQLVKPRNLIIFQIILRDYIILCFFASVYNKI